MKKVWITGALGATGKKLYDYISTNKKDWLCYKTDIKEIENIDNYYQYDLSIEENVLNLINHIKPDIIFHLAGSFSNIFEIDFKCNVLTTKNILDALIVKKIYSRVILVGSSAEYGLVRKEENPISENHQLNPCSIYGLSKVYQYQLMKFYITMFNLDIVMARTFNLLGKDLSEKLFIGKLYSQIEKYKRKEIDKIILGNLDSKRDYITIEKAIERYIIIAEKGRMGEVYNVGSGKSEKIKTILEKILQENNLDFNCIEIKGFTDKYKLDIEDIFADIEKLNKISD